MEVVATIVEKIRDCSFDATCRLFRYLCDYKDNLNRLRIKAERLEYTRERVQEKINDAKRNGENILSDVTNWIQRVDDITKEAEHLIEEADKANKRCLKGLCINPRSRYRSSIQARWKSEDISILQQEGAELESVSRQAPPPRNPLIPSSALSINFKSINFKSRESITRKIMETLKDESVSIIRIWGMGGVGKTTLANEISKQAIEEKLFDSVAMAVVSKTQNYVNIQRDIAKWLDFTLPDEDESARAHFLFQGIMKKVERKQKPEQEVRILIILDNVWERFELERVGIPFACRGCKTVLTSRIHDYFEMNAKTFKVGTLPKEESWGLFRNVAGDIVDNPVINPIAREVSDECCGLPLALVTVAAALKTRDDMYVWIDAKQQLKKSALTNIRGMDRKVFASLKLSYDFLGSKELKSVFLLCCMFPEDFEIPIELLMRYGMGLRLFQEVDTVDEARCRTHAVLSYLISCFLLITGNDKKHVKMHDIVRDFAIKLSKDEHMFTAKAGLGLREWPTAGTFENVTGISLMFNNIREVPVGFEYPKLQVLLLQKNPSLAVPNDFFQGMKDLKVLDMSYIRRLPLTPSPELLAASLTTLCLDYCSFGKEADISLIGRLINLQILSLQGTNITEIPGDFRQLVNLRLFDLKHCQRLRHIPQDVISCLKKLEELYINGDEGLFIELQALNQPSILHAHAEEDGATILLSSAILSKYIPTILQLRSLEKLEVCNFDSMVYVFDFQEFVIAKGETIKFLSSLKDLRLVGLPEMKQIWKDDAKLVSLCNLRKILLQDCSKLRQVFPPALHQSLSSLEYVEISRCDSLEDIFGKEEEGYQQVLKIDHHTTTSPSLLNVTFICISDCRKLKNLLTPSIVKGLVHLRKLEVRDCITMEEIVSDEKAETGASTESITFTRLNSIFLGELGSLSCFCAGRCTIEFPSLEFLNIQSCPKMETFGRGDQVTPKLKMILIESEKHWSDNLNITVQQFYKK